MKKNVLEVVASQLNIEYVSAALGGLDIIFHEEGVAYENMIGNVRVASLLPYSNMGTICKIMENGLRNNIENIVIFIDGTELKITKDEVLFKDLLKIESDIEDFSNHVWCLRFNGFILEFVGYKFREVKTLILDNFGEMPIGTKLCCIKQFEYYDNRDSELKKFNPGDIIEKVEDEHDLPRYKINGNSNGNFDVVLDKNLSCTTNYFRKYKEPVC